MERQGGREGQLWEICLKQPPKLVQEQLQPVLVGVWGVWVMLWRRAPPHSTTLGSAAGHAKSRDMLAGKMLLQQRLLQLGFSLLFLMAPSCDSRLLPLPGARGCSAGSAAAAGCARGGRGCAPLKLSWVGTPHGPGDVGMAGAGSVCRSWTGLGSDRCLKQPLQSPHGPDSPGDLGLWGPLRAFPAPAAWGSASPFWGCRFPQSQAAPCLPLAVRLG